MIKSTGTAKRLRGVHWVPLSHVVKASSTKVGYTVRLPSYCYEIKTFAISSLKTIHEDLR